MRLESHELDTLHIKVCRVLREAILRGHFQPGERLVQEELASSLGVSRMPLREALRKLETEGLAIIESHRGAIVKSLSAEDCAAAILSFAAASLLRQISGVNRAI